MIPGHDDYRVGSDGSVWSKKAGHWKKLTLFRNKDGYLHVKIIPNVKSVGTFRFCKTMLVHRLVLFAFVGEPQSDQVACHNNGIKTDNRLVNLRWGTDYDNAQDYARHKHQIELADYPSEIKFGLYDISWGLWV